MTGAAAVTDVRATGVPDQAQRLAPLYGRDSALALIRAYAAALGRGEGSVAQAILAQPAEVPFWSTQELAHAAGTSTATVIRACQSLGFRGFQHLRLELARETAAHSIPPESGSNTQPSEGAASDGTHPGTLPGAHQRDAVTQAFESARAALAQTCNAIDREALATAACLIASAKRVVCAANGFSSPPLQDAAMRFATIGRPVEAPIDILAQQFAAHTLTADDVCLALSHSGANSHTLATVRAARKRGARVIVLSSYERAPLPELADITVSTGAVGPTHTVDPFFIRLGHSVLLHTLVTEVAARLEPSDALDMREVVADALADGDA